MLYVIKIGGGAGIDMTLAAADIVELLAEHHQIVLIHGCSEAADALGEALGTPPRYVTSIAGVRSRYTNAAALRVFLLAAQGVNAELVATLQRAGVAALGLRGIDGALLRGPRKDVLRIIENGRQRVLRGDFTGRVERVNVELLKLLLAQGYTPVIAPLALADSGEIVNVDGDRAAAAVASALGAAILIVLSNVPGVLTDTGDGRLLVQHICAEEVQGYEHRVTGGMRRKLLSAREALHGSVQRVILADGRVEHPVRAALAEKGTVIV